MDLDLQFDEYEIFYSKDKIFESLKKLKENSNIKYKEITLTNKNDFYELISDIESKLSEYSFQKKNIYNVKYYYPLKETHQFNKDGIYLNCILLGGEGSGKDSFLSSLIGESTSNILSTIEINSLAFNCEVNGEKIYFRIFNSDKERFRPILKNYNGIHAFLLFFDVTNEDSFNLIKIWMKSKSKNIGRKNKQYELFLIANNFDEFEKRVINRSNGKYLSSEYNEKYFEISCMNKINIYELLYNITYLTYEKCKGFDVSYKNAPLKNKNKNLYSLYKYINY